MSKLLDSWRGKAVVMKDSAGHIGAWYVCPRCHGRGVFMRFSHVHRGKCFKCFGSGFARLPKAAERAVLKAVGIQPVAAAA